ncbi:MAG: MFS transporter [Candidatus Moraniibacteriota bacterium]
MEREKVAGNLRNMYVIRAIRSGMFSIPIIMEFFAENGVGLRDAIVLQSLFSWAAIAFEIPTGQFADAYGRKIAIVLGCIFSTLGFSFYAISYEFYGFLLAEVILALGMSFISGAYSAFLFDNQEEAKESGQSILLEGKSGRIGMLAEATTSLIGGSFLALISLRTPFYFDVALASVGIIFALRLVEPKVQRKVNRESSLVAAWRVLLLVHNHKEVKSLIFFSAVCSAATLNMVWFIQPYWISSGIPKFLFGVMWALLLLFGAKISDKAYSIEKRLGRKFSLLVILVASIVGYFFLGNLNFIWSSVFILPFYIARGLNEPITKNYVNLKIAEEDRSTILSIKSLVGRLIFSIVGPMMGWVGEAYSLQTALLVSGITFSLMGLVAWMFLVKHKAA